MPTLGIGKINSGFTLIELLIVLILIGVSSSFLMLNTNLINIFETSEYSVQEYFQSMSDESILRGRTLHWFLKKDQEHVYLDEYANDSSLLQLNDKSFIDLIGSDTMVTIKTSQGIEYLIDQNYSSIPMISFYPSGETSGALITMDNANGTYKVIVRTNGDIEKISD